MRCILLGGASEVHTDALFTQVMGVRIVTYVKELATTGGLC